MIAEIEDAIVRRLRDASEADLLGYHYRSVASYSGEFDEDRLREVIKAYPAAWVSFASEPRPDYLGNNTYRHYPSFLVMLAARSLRNEAAARHGADGAVGSYQMVKDARALLIGQSFGLEIEGLAPGIVRPLVEIGTKGQQLSVLVHEFQTAYESAAPAAGDETADFLHFHTDWDLPPHGNVGPELPDDGADAQDDVTLPGPGA